MRILATWVSGSFESSAISKAAVVGRREMGVLIGKSNTCERLGEKKVLLHLSQGPVQRGIIYRKTTFYVNLQEKKRLKMTV